VVISITPTPDDADGFELELAAITAPTSWASPQ
jgi:hypothetical protein